MKTLSVALCIAAFSSLMLAGCGQCEGDATITILVGAVDGGALDATTPPQPSDDAGAVQGKPAVGCEPYCTDLGPISSR
jgi:hypothetical protein